ncbi:hypothetical protein K501DRAFT_279598 [Backusella circina FSU 941]|nr:hypothetical protein K501DRAFT_279598 [Backusella circina FSU 941]
MPVSDFGDIKRYVDCILEDVLMGRARSMKIRFNNLKAKGHAYLDFRSGLPTNTDIYQLFVDSKCKCTATGWVFRFVKWKEQNSWFVTFDHTDPVSTTPSCVNPWTISNIQVIYYLLVELV